MPTYITFPIDSEPEDLFALAVASLQARFPGWEPNLPNLDTAMLEAIAAMASDLKDLASQVPDSIFRYFGASLLGRPPVDASPASVSSTWTAIDNAGHTVTAGTQVGIRDSAGTLHPFYVQSDVTINVGSTSVSGVNLIAVEAGLAASGLGGAGQSIELIDPLAWVSGVTIAAATTGGADAESDSDYLNRLRAVLQTLSPRPILPRDFSLLARDVSGVYRSTTVDGYNTADSTYNNERMVTVFATDSAGADVSSPTKTALANYLDSLRETNFVVNVGSPSFSTIDVAVTVKAVAGFDTTAVHDAVVAALNAYFDPLNWGVPPDGDARDWNNVTTVRYLEVAQVVNSVEGVDYITTTSGNYDLTIAVHPNALARADLTLTGPAPLTHPGTFTVTVT